MMNWGAALVLMGSAAASAGETDAARLTDRLPFGRAPIDYHSTAADDAVARLVERIEAGEIKLQKHETLGFLPAVLDALRVPVESQLLVFSKTALNQQLVGPETPRAVYFNDEIFVARVPGAATIELAAIDPLKGTIFYELHSGADGRAQVQRSGRCIACHAGAGTLHVPGLIVRSFLTDATGKPTTGHSQVTHSTPLEKRWAGWYVTGQTGNAEFGMRNAELANAVSKTTPHSALRTPHSDQYPAGTSDIVAHLVLNHQAHGLNLIIRAGFEARLGQRSDVEDRLVRYLLFADEAALPGPVGKSSEYAAWFQTQGPRDSRGRSLRQLDLHTRLFRYRMSYLIYSRAFDGLPVDVRDRLYQRLWDALTTADHIPTEERQAIIEILRETKPELPEYWR
ncbi:MAG: hypothetical protein ACREJB_12965 [Planctomycetaceae bacterium]